MIIYRKSKLIYYYTSKRRLGIVYLIIKESSQLNNLNC